jgi:hypothetical protein
MVGLLVNVGVNVGLLLYVGDILMEEGSFDLLSVSACMHRGERTIVENSSSLIVDLLCTVLPFFLI